MRISPSASHSRMSVHQNHILINKCFRWEWPSDQRPPYWTTPVGQTLSAAPLVEPLFLWLLLISNQGKRWTLQYSLNIEVLAIVWDDQVTDIYTESFHDQCREERRNKCLKYRSTLWFGFIWSDAEAECSSRGGGQKYHINNYFGMLVLSRNWDLIGSTSYISQVPQPTHDIHTYIYDCSPTHSWLFIHTFMTVFLLRYYSFECQCLACVQDWPQLEKLPKGVSQTPGLRSNSETQVSHKGNGVDEFLWWILPEMGSRSRETTIRGRGVALLHFTRLLFCNHRYLKHTG